VAEMAMQAVQKEMRFESLAIHEEEMKEKQME